MSSSKDTDVLPSLWSKSAQSLVDAWHWAWTREGATLLLVAFSMFFFGVVQSVAVTEMSFVMPAFPAWLLYFTTLLYTIQLFVTAIVMGEQPFSKENLSWARQKHNLMLGLLTSLNGVLFQFSTAWVDGETGSVMANWIVPQIILIEMGMMRIGWLHRGPHTMREWVATAVVILGIILGMIPAFKALRSNEEQAASATEQADQWYWVLAYFLSTTFQAAESVWQEKAFTDVGREVRWEASCLAYYNLYTCIVYVFFIFFESIAYINGTTQSTTVAQAIDNQAGAFLCAFGNPRESDVVAGNCQTGATWWPWIFVFSYAFYYWTNATLTRFHGALFANVIGAVIPLTVSLVFCAPAIVGATHADVFQPWVLVGCVIVAIGIVGKGVPSEDEEKETSDAADALLQKDGSINGVAVGSPSGATGELYDEHVAARLLPS